VDLYTDLEVGVRVEVVAARRTYTYFPFSLAAILKMAVAMFAEMEYLQRD
jgi:hypothetical protein